MARYIKLLAKFFTYTVQQAMIYRVDFAVWSLVAIGWFMFNIAFFELLFTQVTTLGGWNKGQVFVLQGFYFLFECMIWGIFYANFVDFPQRVNRGQIDYELTKPINARFLFSFKQFNLDNSMNVILGIATIAYGLALNNYTPTIVEIVLSAMIFVISGVYVYAGYFALTCLCFWFERLNNIIFIFPQIRQFIKIPLSGYKGVAKVILSYVVPAALIATIPAEAIFGVFQLQYIAVLTGFAVATLAFSSFVFSQGLKRYSSASS